MASIKPGTLTLTEIRDYVEANASTFLHVMDAYDKAIKHFSNPAEDRFTTSKVLYHEIYWIAVDVMYAYWNKATRAPYKTTKSYTEQGAYNSSYKRI